MIAGRMAGIKRVQKLNVNMCVCLYYIHVYMYVCVYVHVCVYICMYVYVYVYIYMYIRLGRIYVMHYTLDRIILSFTVLLN